MTGAYRQLWLAPRMNTSWVSAWGGDDLTTSKFSSRAAYYKQNADRLLGQTQAYQ